MPQPTTKLRFKDLADHAIWITIYVGDSRTGNVARNCVLPGQEITLDGSGKVLQQLWYNMLAEVKESATSFSTNSNKYEIYREHIGDTRPHVRHHVLTPQEPSIDWFEHPSNQSLFAADVVPVTFRIPSNLRAQRSHQCR